jgi:cytochrome c553
MKDLILPIAIILGTAVLISISYSSIEVKGRPSVNACNGECYDDFVVADKERKALLSAQQATATPAELGSKTYTTVCMACHGDKGQGVVGPALTGRDTEYLLTALAAYKTGETRGNQSALMWAQSAALSQSDMENVAAYIVTF